MKKHSCSKSIPSIFLVFCTTFLLSVMPLQGSTLQRQHITYLSNTEHELHVFRIYGEKPGKTLILIGGIQGDEPGGYLTADLYADITLKQGNLIVVPRANFYSILLNQRDGLTGDMNRKFGTTGESTKSMEQEIVSILKELIGQADCLLNLHEGSGYFHPEWISEQENSKRYGQSIIYDAASYYSEKKEKTIRLDQLAKRITEKVNPQIEKKRYRFKANNHNTVAENSDHIEQRKSATYYALTQANIPAFGIETSKSMRSNSEKVRLQKMVINAFMEEFDIIPDTPGPHIGKTELNYVLVQINNELPYAVPNRTELQIESGDEVLITDIIANFDRGLAADFVGIGSHNDTNMPFRIAQPTKIIIRKDAETCGWINLVVNGQEITPPTPTQAITAPQPPPKTPTILRSSHGELRAEEIYLNINGDLFSISEGEELLVPRDKPLIIKGIRSNLSRFDNKIFANLKGYAPPKAVNDGNDINYPIYPEQDLWKRFSEKKAGFRYPIIANYQDKRIGTFWIRLQD